MALIIDERLVETGRSGRSGEEREGRDILEGKKEIMIMEGKKEDSYRLEPDAIIYGIVN